MVNICDMIMGSGKSSAAINYMNENSERKYIYITPYLEECTRIKESCPDLDFVEPCSGTKSKTENIKQLLKEKHNIASTHTAMRLYDKEITDLIFQNKYTLIIDEAVDLRFQTTSINVSILLDALINEYIEIDEDTFETTLTGKNYEDCKDKNVVRFLNSLSDKGTSIYKKGDQFYIQRPWVYSSKLFQEDLDIFVLTYMFKGSEMYAFMKINNINYQYIGIKHENEKYEFCDVKDLTLPPYSPKELITIIEDEKLNSIGENYYDLSKSRYTDLRNGLKESKYSSKAAGVLRDYKRKLSSYFNYITKSKSSNNIVGIYGSGEQKDTDALWEILKNDGYSKARTNFNLKATNKYSDCHTLAYMVNIFTGNIFDHYKKLGYEVDEDNYALSTMLQWIWRSAIRKGEPITLYVPSSRMRNLLKEWIEQVETSRHKSIA